MKRIIIPQNSMGVSEILLDSCMDLPNPHAIIAKNRSDIVGIVCRARKDANVWLVRWNHGGESDCRGSVRELIVWCSSQADIEFYLIKL